MQSGIDLRWLMYNWATIVGFHRWPAVCSHGIQCKKEVKKLTLYKILKNIWDEVILCFFRNCFPISENITFIDVTLNKILATKYMQAYLHIEKYRLFSMITGHGSKKVLLMKFEILGFAFPCRFINTHVYCQLYTIIIIVQILFDTVLFQKITWSSMESLVKSFI